MEGSGRGVEAGTSRAPGDARSTAEENGEDKKVGVEEEEVEGREEEDEDEEDGLEENAGAAAGFVPAPPISLREQLEKDKDDESLTRWKEKLLGCVGEIDDHMEPEVTFYSLGIVSNGCPEFVTPLPVNENQSRILFTLKEGSQYRLKLTFIVKNNLVSGLAYSNTVWKGGLQVDQTKGMLGTFAPQRDPYIHMLDEETTPSGVLARGIYSAKLKFTDDDKRCYLELHYSFDIKKR